jgi:hypothetical protein
MQNAFSCHALYLVHGTASPATETSVHVLVIEQQQYVD